MPSKGKFLLIVGNIDTFWTHRIALARAIIKDGWDLHLATSNASKDDRLRLEGITPHDLPSYTSSLNPLGQIRALMAILKIMRVVRPDMIHAITLRFSVWSGIARRILRLETPIVFTIAGLGSLFLSDALSVRIVRVALIPFLKCIFSGGPHRVIFQNADDGKTLIRLGAVDQKNASLIRGSGVDMTEFYATPEPLSDSPMVLFSSRLLRAKGIGEFVHAARIVKSKGINARFVVAGDVATGNHDSITRAEMEGWHDEGAVEWLGHQGDMAALMRQSSMVVLPSYYGEGVPKVLLEAASSARPIITTTMPGCRDVVQDGVSGILVEPRDAWALAAAIERLVTDYDLRARMGTSGRARAQDLFDVTLVNAKTIAVYGKLSAGNKKTAQKAAS